MRTKAYEAQLRHLLCLKIQGGKLTSGPELSALIDHKHHRVPPGDEKRLAVTQLAPITVHRGQ